MLDLFVLCILAVLCRNVITLVNTDDRVRRRKNRFFISFKRPEIYGVRSVKLALTKLTSPSTLPTYFTQDNSPTKTNKHVLNIFSKKSSSVKRIRFRSVLKSQKYDIFNVTEICTKQLEDPEFDGMLEFNIAFRCCCGESPSWVGDVYQLASRRKDSPLLLFYDDVNTDIWNNSKVQVRKFELNNSLRDKRSIKSARRMHPPPCKLRPWTVKVEDIGWSDRVYLPTAILVNYCWGQCRFLGNVNVKTTNHALIKYLFYREQGQRKKRIINRIGGMKWACCTPNQFQSIKVIYQGLDGSIVYKEWDNVSAVSCGCQ